MKNSRFELSHTEKIRRSIYVFLRDELERKLLSIAFLEPYRECHERRVAFPYVDPTELRPRNKREFGKESGEFRPFFLVFCEDHLNEAFQKYVRFNDSNKVKKENISLVPDIRLQRSFNETARFFEQDTFFELLDPLLDVDYCVLLQRDLRVRNANRFALSHFHVKIDWPIADAAESLAKELRYISKNLYEKGEKYAETLQQKLFEYYGCHHQATGGRRTAALIAAQYLKFAPGLSTVYVSSAESRTLTRYSEKGVGRYALIQMDKAYARHIAETYAIPPETFRQGYILGENDNSYDLLLFVTYDHTEYAQPPADGKLRFLKPDYSWLSVSQELILPLPHAQTCRPLPVKYIYRN
ncbi:MAG: hypothetical protein BWY87_00082 [Deltaproteobacteria bacterium ADurb.Bin510]|nr:MAG: hypothetical protein BWY87_00082 [Deltaproteobacteria bacterium ADurb.Bin510]